MNVVVDTNIFVSSFYGGNPRKVIDLWKAGRINLCLCPEILEEYFEVLRRLGLDEESDFKDLLDLFSHAPNVLFSTKTPNVRVVPDDPDDDKFVACALALKAEVIVTGDKAFEAVKAYRRIKIMSPARFLRDFSGQGD